MIYTKKTLNKTTKTNIWPSRLLDRTLDCVATIYNHQYKAWHN